VCVLQGTFDPNGPFLFSERADALTACAQFALRCLHEPRVAADAAAAFGSICAQGGCALQLGTEGALESLLPPLLLALATPPLSYNSQVWCMHNMIWLYMYIYVYR